MRAAIALLATCLPAFGAEMLPQLVFAVAELPADCEFVIAVSGETRGKRSPFGPAISRTIALRNMLMAAYDAGATHVVRKDEHAGTSENPFGGYSLSGDAYRCPDVPAPAAESKAPKRPPSRR